MADPGFVKREGRESKCRDAAPGLKKVAQRGGGGGGGGDPTHFFSFSSFRLWDRDTVRLLDQPPGWENKIGRKKGGGGGPRPIRPPGSATVFTKWSTAGNWGNSWDNGECAVRNLGGLSHRALLSTLFVELLLSFSLHLRHYPSGSYVKPTTSHTNKLFRAMNSVWEKSKFPSFFECEKQYMQ